GTSQYRKGWGCCWTGPILDDLLQEVRCLERDPDGKAGEMMSDPLFIIGKAPFKSPREIIPGVLYQSGAAEAMDICSSGEMLQKLGLKAVLTVAHDIRMKVPANMVHLHLPVDEINPTDPKYFDL